jgi:glycosyltransferase involved in cell wall biosynthesis
VLVFAYACRPTSGSEPAAGWGLVQSVAEFADLVVLLGPNSTEATLRWQTEHGDPRITFVPVPEPRWAPVAKRHRVTWFPLYLSWLRSADRVARQLHQAQPFDLVHHATYSVYWLPTPAAALGPPWVWGPVGGAVTTPRDLWPLLSLRGVLSEVLDFTAVHVMSRWSSTQRTWRSATVRLVQNEATLARLPASLQRTTRVLNHALFTVVPPTPAADARTDVLWVGVLAARKGVRLAVLALARTPADVHLVIVGDGPERRALERLVRRLNLSDRVHFKGWVPRATVFGMLSGAAAALFTGLREEGGIALAEAMISGVPVIVLANGGARTIAAASTDPSRVALIEPGPVSSTAARMAEAMTRFARAPRERRESTLDQAAARATLRAAFSEALGVSVTDSGEPVQP